MYYSHFRQSWCGVIFLVFLASCASKDSNPNGPHPAIDVATTDNRPIAPGKFRSFGGGTGVVYAQNVNRDGTLTNVFISRNAGPIVEVALADSARHTVSGDGMTHILTLYDGERFEGVPGSP